MSRPSIVQIIAMTIIVAAVSMSVYLLVRKEKPVLVEPIIPDVVLDEPEVAPRPESVIIGSSVEGRAIEAYTYGTGTKHILFIGGIHGGYEWNSVLLAYEFIDYVRKNPSIVSPSLTVTVIPSANPDGLFEVLKKEGRFTLADVPTTARAVGTGRFNAHNVDLNRNFDCKWQPQSMWRGNVVSAGTSAFSEPESVALRNYIIAHPPISVVFWHSQADAVYASECEAGILPETLRIMDIYAKAAQYPAVSTFDAYTVTGDAEGWLASINIPAITVELKTHETIEWEKNLAGIRALLAHYK